MEGDPMEGHPAGFPPRSRSRSSLGSRGLSPCGSLEESHLLDRLTPRQRRDLRHHWQGLQEPGEWSEALPVLLLDRCWLRLSVESLAGLARRLPPDASGAAPELMHYQHLLLQGLGGLEAQQRCWEEFGPEACREAQRRFWSARERGNQGWTLDRYLHLRSEYRHRWRVARPRPLPVLVLAREGAEGDPGPEAEHHLLWLCPAADEPDRPMRHTCP
jgi:hypothetical protein